MGLKETLVARKQFLEAEIVEINASIAAMTRKKTVRLVAILDKSISMESLTHSTITGFNKFIDEQRKDNSTELLVSLVQFANPGALEQTFMEWPISLVQPLTAREYRASGGSTALNDAIGLTLQGLKVNSNDAYVVLVITDGQENSSRAFTKAQVRELIGAFEAKGNFTFVFMGSDPSTWAEAASYGVQYSNTMNFSPTAAGVAASYDVGTRGLSNLRSSVAMGESLSTTSYVQDVTQPANPAIDLSNLTGTAPTGASITITNNNPSLAPTVSTPAAKVPPSLSTDSTGKGI